LDKPNLGGQALGCTQAQTPNQNKKECLEIMSRTPRAGSTRKSTKQLGINHIYNFQELLMTQATHHQLTVVVFKTNPS